ncbi:unnamed protein product [Phytophthora fragariaefolia]|uniref:Unnamed protein product n=1 Tax=Phytophthora fragariaefolia TaxID=1490495 RepID=A0A9W6U9K8_9STRA|nr:unnamed protein product [Phytophthora fragariaefolia]
MAELASDPADARNVTSDPENPPAEWQAADRSPGAAKRSAAEAFDASSVEDLKGDETTLDDVLAGPSPKRSKLLDAELPDVDDDEQFPRQQEEDAELALGLAGAPGMEAAELDTGTGGDRHGGGQDTGLGDLDTDRDVEELAPPEEDESEPPTSQNNEIDIVDVDDDDESAEDEHQQLGGLEEDDDDEERETARAIARAQNQREARQLLLQLDDSARSKLCLTALEKYGEELFYGHEDARDAILVDACAQDSVLSLMRDAIRVRDLYLRGTSAAAPVELDDDEDDEEDEDEETGGYEDEEEDADDEDDEDVDKLAASNEDDDDDVVIISEEEEEEEEREEEHQAGTVTANATLSPGNEGQTGPRTDESNDDDDDDEDDEEVDTDGKAYSAEEANSNADENDESSAEETKEGEDAALDVGAAGDSAPGSGTST